MNVADISQAPEAYRDVVWIADTCKLIMGIGWTANYVGMIRKSLKDQTYAMALLPLCCNFAWELTYAIMYAFTTSLEKYVHFSGLLLNCGVMYTAVKNAPREWEHAPLVQRNLRLIFVLAVAGFASAHVVLAKQVGPELGQAWSAYACQLLLSVGGLCQLLCRGHSRGASYFLWFSRFFGSLVLVPQDIIRYTYWKEAHEFMGSPMYIWFVTIFLILDGSYGLCLWYVRRFEQQNPAAGKLKK
ncbi:hypothetical protein CH63R_05476 [Colletotrichum higginsianum IMI 349063]|uniref:Terpene cyclase dpchB n=2 Tax=Colletotrichum higginsianum TaxID=80884 RepID=DPCHB_COLHI|nr:hypothetical protein CH63R_05476 [Colletotrichum higginsianum IMI 349063]A0A1B7YCX1.1 RecName: Full=Terpene cyclase dpchB; AltName: Full=Diterpenoid pyrone biosynthesis cluster protein B [Colletotrichum higginsianum IMI 349063]OBR09784.1 hypothetical protein CH63R_05476 [Colletotrichum higginsianum IMI 349063]TID06372.1 Terpene cyclase atmB [Colletotrichum higginsianum]